ncbi:MAG TPA: TolC family protein, partial [Vicinamibacterales bacterium]|nr:TolC family protein [Vicinamibacterales bacterium]
MRTAVFCAALAAALAPANVGAQSLNLTEADALARLSAESPRARAVRADVEVARADVLNAGRWPNPRVTFDRESVAGVTENIVIVAQPLPITGRRGFEVQAASAMAGAASSRSDDEIRRLRADLRLAFADLVAAQARERQLTTSRDRLRELADVLARREAAGDAAGFDLLRAEREVLEVDTDRALVAIERARA